jgi:hypothetical protein
VPANGAGSPPRHGQGARNNNCGDRTDLVLLRARAQHPHIRWEFMWRGSHGDVVVVALTPPSGAVVQVARRDERDVHPRLASLVADRIAEEIARLSVGHALRDIERSALVWPDRWGSR